MKQKLELYPPNDILDQTWQELVEDPNDRATAIMAVALVDNVLEQAIRRRLRVHKSTENVLSWNGGIGTLSSKIHFAHAIGLIGDLFYHDLLTVNDIRNKFAHGLIAHDQHHKPIKMSFDSPSITGLCKKLKLVAQPSGVLARHIFLHEIHIIIAHLMHEIKHGHEGVIESEHCKD
jgi:hypothetical protein